jgi:cyanophycin synthetase
VAVANSTGTEYDIDADLQKMREIRERVRLGRPSTGSVCVTKYTVSRDIPWIRLGILIVQWDIM